MTTNEMSAPSPAEDSSQTPIIKSVVFDMGGVFVELGPITEVIGDQDLTVAEFWSKWLKSPVVRRFERGGCSPSEFGDELVEEFELTMSGQEFVTRFAAWPRGLFVGAAELIAELKATNMELSVLSNTNELHWTTQQDHELVQEMFDHEFTSYVVGMVKPDAEIFEHVVSVLGHQPGQVLFLDDNQPNVDGAIAVGMQARLTRGVEELRSALVDVGLLPG